MKKYKVIENHIILRAMTTIAFLLCLLLALGSCTEEKKTQEKPDFNENGLFVSDAFSYEELKEYYSQNREVSLNDAEGKLAQMEITEDDEGTYRVVIQKIDDKDKSAPFIEFYLKTAESEETYTIEKIQKVEVSAAMNQKEAVFLGDFICWLRENNTIEYSLNGDIYAAADVEEDVVCKEVTENHEIQLRYLTNGKVKNKKGEYIYVHETIMPLSFERT